MQTIVIFLNIFLIVLALCLVLFNIAYAKGVHKIQNNLGIKLPSFLERLLAGNIIIAVSATIFIIFLTIAIGKNSH